MLPALSSRALRRFRRAVRLGPRCSIARSTQAARTLTVHSRRPAATLVDLVKWIDQQGLELTDVSLKQPSLEDVFIELTGKSLRE